MQNTYYQVKVQSANNATSITTPTHHNTAQHNVKHTSILSPALAVSVEPRGSILPLLLVASTVDRAMSVSKHYSKSQLVAKARDIRRLLAYARVRPISVGILARFLSTPRWHLSREVKHATACNWRAQQDSGRYRTRGTRYAVFLQGAPYLGHGVV